MSIKLADSPFKSLNSPCRFARESMNCMICSCKDAGVISCNLYHQQNCDYYQEADKETFKDTTNNDLRTHWKKIYGDQSYWYECSHCGDEPPHTSYNDEWLSNYCPACGRYMYSQEEQLTDIPKGVYQHYKGRYYEVLGVAEHSESTEKLVVYKALYGKYQIYVRPLEMFIELIEDVKYHYRGPRFFPLRNCISKGIEEDA